MSPVKQRAALIPGTLELLILRTLLLGPLHGHGIAKHIQNTSKNVLQVDHGSLYPALHRLERNGYISSKWEQTPRGREMRMYRLERKGRKQLGIEESRWRELFAATIRILKPV
jgi:transcriptional regulator